MVSTYAEFYHAKCRSAVRKGHGSIQWPLYRIRFLYRIKMHRKTCLATMRSLKLRSIVWYELRPRNANWWGVSLLFIVMQNGAHQAQCHYTECRGVQYGWPPCITRLDQILFILNILCTFVTKHATSMRRSTVLSLPLQLVFPAQAYHF